MGTKEVLMLKYCHNLLMPSLFNKQHQKYQNGLALKLCRRAVRSSFLLDYTGGCQTAVQKGSSTPSCPPSPSPPKSTSWPCSDFRVAGGSTYPLYILGVILSPQTTQYHLVNLQANFSVTSKLWVVAVDI